MTIYQNIFGPKKGSIRGTETRPTATGTEQDIFTWFQDCVNDDVNSGTIVEARVMNFVIAQFREAITRLGVTLDESDDLMLYKCFQAVAATAPVAAATANFAECQLNASGGSVVLTRYRGFRLTFPNGEHVPVPVSGASLSASGLTNGTVYNIYAYKNSTVVGLEAATTGYTVDSSTGIVHKTGDATRVLVGKASPSGGAFVDTNGTLLVLSFFNRRRRASVVQLGADVDFGSRLNFAEVSTGLRTSFLTWGDEPVDIFAQVQGHAGNNYVRLVAGIAVDGTVLSSKAGTTGTTVGTSVSGEASGGTGIGIFHSSPHDSRVVQNFAEGLHTASLYGRAECYAGADDDGAPTNVYSTWYGRIEANKRYNTLAQGQSTDTTNGTRVLVSVNG